MSFVDQIDGFVDRANRVVQDISKEIVIELFSAIVYDTPVDYGPLRGSWQVTAGASASSDIGRVDTSGADVISDIRSSVAGGIPDVLYLSNLKHYAHRIEYDGWSHTKAPEGMVRRNTVRFGQIANDAIRNNI